MKARLCYTQYHNRKYPKPEIDMSELLSRRKRQKNMRRKQINGRCSNCDKTGANVHRPNVCRLRRRDGVSVRFSQVVEVPSKNARPRRRRRVAVGAVYRGDVCRSDGVDGGPASACDAGRRGTTASTWTAAGLSTRSPSGARERPTTTETASTRPSWLPPRRGSPVDADRWH